MTRATYAPGRDPAPLNPDPRDMPIPYEAPVREQFVPGLVVTELDLSDLSPEQRAALGIES